MNAADAVVLPFENVLSSGLALLAMTFGRGLVAPEIGCVEALLNPGGGIGYDPSRIDVFVGQSRPHSMRTWKR